MRTWASVSSTKKLRRYDCFLVLCTSTAWLRGYQSIDHTGWRAGTVTCALDRGASYIRCYEERTQRSFAEGELVNSYGSDKKKSRHGWFEFNWVFFKV
jgi:hypothetical protein